MEATAIKNTVKNPPRAPKRQAQPNFLKIDNKCYYVQSVFIGNEDMKSVFLRIAERKTMQDMGLDVVVSNSNSNSNNSDSISNKENA